MLVTTTTRHCRPLNPRRRISTRAKQPWKAPWERAGEVAKKLREELPVIGLISKLTTPTGVGLSHELSYQEFSRGVYDTLDDDVNSVCYDLQKEYGESAQLRFILCILWMARGLFGTMPAKIIVQSAARLRGTRDVEDEISQFEMLREEEKQKYGYGEAVDYASKNLIPTAVDGLVRLVSGVTETDEISKEAEEKLTAVILHVFPTTPVAEIEDAFEKRSDRSYLYT